MRVISVLVPPVLIGDGQVPLPAIGETVRYYLRFTEVPRESGDPLASTFTARADPVGDGSPRCGMRFDGTPHDRPPYFPPDFMLMDGAHSGLLLVTLPANSKCTVPSSPSSVPSLSPIWQCGAGSLACKQSIASSTRRIRISKTGDRSPTGEFSQQFRPFLSVLLKIEGNRSRKRHSTTRQAGGGNRT